MKTTNYYNTFIESAEDCPLNTAEIPPYKEKKTVALIQYEMIINNPYKYTSDDVVFHVFALKQGINEDELVNERSKFFSKGQPCFRSSPLLKRYGWGLHSDQEGKIALYAMESDAYGEFLNDQNLRHLKAMRSFRK